MNEMIEMQLMVFNKEKGKYQGNGSVELQVLPRKYDYFVRRNKNYIVDRVVISDENMYDLYLTHVDIEYFESFIDS